MAVLMVEPMALQTVDLLVDVMVVSMAFPSVVSMVAMKVGN